MPSHAESRCVPFSATQMYALVADIERYPEFLPWCKSARIIKRQEHEIIAELSIGFKMFRDCFTSRVELTPHHRIATHYEKGPLSHLKSEWLFTPQEKHAKSAKTLCQVDFSVDFSFRSTLLNAMMEMFFDHAFRRMVEAFERRATCLYAEKSE